MSEGLDDVVIVNFTKYHNQMNELTFLRDLAINLYTGDKKIEDFRKELEILNKKYKWWC